MYGKGEHFGRILKSISVLMLVVFLFNLFSVVPAAASHHKEDGVSHVIASDVADLSGSADKNRHDHIENCGMVTCSITVSVFTPLIKDAFLAKLTYSIVTDRFKSLDFTPPGRPPRA